MPLTTLPLRSFAFALLVAALLATSCVSTRINDAQYYFDRGMLDEADAIASEVLRSQPSNPDALYLKGRIEGTAGRYEEMNRYFNESLDVSHKYRNKVIFHRGRLWAEKHNAGIALFNAGAFEAARDTLLDAHTIRPEVPVTKISLEIARLQVPGEDERAAEYLSSLPPDELTITHLNNLASYYERRNDFVRIVEVSSVILEKDPRHVNSIRRLAPACVMTGQLALARDSYLNLISLGDDGYILRRDLGRACYELGEYACAAENLERALWSASTDKETFDATYFLGLAYYEQERFYDMATSFEKLAEMEPDHIGVWNSLVVAYTRLQKKEEALAALAQVDRLEEAEEEGAP